jgi:hypothetical protein
MNWLYFVDDTVNIGINAVLSAPIVPLTRYVPAGNFGYMMFSVFELAI